MKNFTDYFINFIFVLPMLSVFLSFLSFLVIFFLGFRLGNIGSIFISIVSTGISLFFIIVYCLFSFYHIFNFSKTVEFKYSILEFDFGSWIDVCSVSINWGFQFDTLSLVMIFVILFITFVVQLYCIDYMQGDPFVSKFYSYLSLFAFFMLFLVSSSNYIQLFLGWEGVGLASFLLISFWTTRVDAVLSGLKAMIVNRVGDVFFLFSSVLILSNFYTLNFGPLFQILEGYFNSDDKSFIIEIYIFGFALFFAAMAKSAQLGLHTWLPDAMEGPTPVSALIHAATMVTAGVFVIVRSSFIFPHLPYLQNFIVFIGGFTALFGSTVACVQYDLKKVVAYSTCSQLGYMIIACGTFNYTGAMFHLFTHAFFKALLFLSSGSVIHALDNEQDMRKMGGLIRFLPFTFFAFFVGSLSLLGFPFFSGFYSKDNILEHAYLSHTYSGYLGFFLGLLSVFFTAFYSFRLLYMVFFGVYRGSANKFIHEPPVYMTLSLAILIIPSVTFGFIFYSFFVGEAQTVFWCDSLYIKPAAIENFELNNLVSVLPLFFSFSGFLMSYYVYNYSLDLSYFSFYQVVFRFLAKSWYFDEIYNRFAIFFLDFLYYNYWLVVEKSFLDFFGPRGVANLFRYFSSFLNKFQNLGFSFSFETLFTVFILLILVICFGLIKFCPCSLMVKR